MSTPSEWLLDQFDTTDADLLRCIRGSVNVAREMFQYLTIIPTVGVEQSVDAASWPDPLPHLELD